MNSQIFKIIKDFLVQFLKEKTEQLKEYNKKREEEKQNKLTNK